MRMRLILSVLVVAGMLTSALYSAEKESALELTVTFTDGSLIYGSAALKTLSLLTESCGTVNVPLKTVRKHR